MDKTTHLSNPESSNVKPKPKRRRSPAVRTSTNKPQKRLRKKQTGEFKWNLLLISIEMLGLSIIAVSAIIMLLGYSASRFSGTSFFSSLLPFAIGVLALVLVACVFLIGWWKLRKWLQSHSELLTPILSLSFALLIACLLYTSDAADE